MNVLLKPFFLKGKPSPTLRINETSNRLSTEGIKNYKFGFGQSPFPVPEIVVNALKEHAFHKDYLSVNGLLKLRETIASYNSKKNINDNPDDIIIGPGSKSLIYLLQLVFDGELLLPKPSWVSYEPQAQILKKPVKWLETFAENGWMLHPDTLEDYCKKNPNSQKLLILNYPSNPTGATYDSEQLKAVANVADQFGLIIISDEIYGELNHRGTHQSLAKYYPEGTIVSSGLSKWCGAGGWRLGTCTFPKKMESLVEAMKIAASESYSSVCTPVQFAAVIAYEQGPQILQYLENSRMVLSKISSAISGCLKKVSINHPTPQGGFYLMPDFEYYRANLKTKGIETSEQFCNKLIKETGVALLPGSAFGLPANKLAARLSYVDFDGRKALDLANSNGNVLNDYSLKNISGHMLQGIERLKSWLEDEQ
jgi:aspartate aminotransferase